MKTNNKKIIKIIAVVGPTASGKSEMAIKLANEFNGEIINSDSRQVYKYLNIGTAKDRNENSKGEDYIVNGVKHHLIDFLDPDEKFSVAEFQKGAREIILTLNKNNKLPFLVGGTGLWIDSVCKAEYIFNQTKANWNLRENLKNMNPSDLLHELDQMNPRITAQLNHSDKNNPVRLMRLIEKEESTNDSQIYEPKDEGFYCSINALYLSPPVNFDHLEQKIYTRVEKMFEVGLLTEIKELIDKGCDFKSPGFSGIGYKEFEKYFKGEITLEDVKNEIKLRTRQYAKRQITWFKRNKDINYVDFAEARKLVKAYI